jgi:ADP-heptose:LPS heptosyltransferase
MPEDPTLAVIAMPLVRSLRASRPDAAITAVCLPAHAPLLKHSGLCEHVLEIPPAGEKRRTFFRSIRRMYADVWIDFSGNVDAGTEGHMAEIPQRFGIIGPGPKRKHFNQLWDPPAGLSGPEAAPFRVMEGFLRHFGLMGEIDLSPISFHDLPKPLPSTNPSVRWIGMHVGSQTDESGRWPVSQWRGLIEQLLETDPSWSIALLGGADDRIIANDIGAHYPLERVLNLTENLPLLEIAGAMNQSRVVVAANPAAMVLANGLGIATVALFGPLNPAIHAPPFFSPAWTLQPPDCPETGGGALSGLSWETVAEAATRALQA